MAYLLKYYKEISQKDGTIIRLEIHKKQTSDAGWVAVEIGPVLQGLSLEIQGQQGDIDTPIVKTSLSMTFVDASDLETGKKTGFWDEFYTPDALMWKVVLLSKKAQENTFTTMWGGYVTPDSYSESLVYRGSVNIIARDNIGHLQDFPFDGVADGDGMMTLFDILASGWAKIESPMDLDFGTSDEWMFTEGQIAYDTMVNVALLADKNWYEVMESLLYSYGLVMRYIGEGVVKICPLRYMPRYGYVSVDAVPHVEPVFVAGAQRDLVPAVKRIEESHSYELENQMQMPKVNADDYSGEVVTTDFTTNLGKSFSLYDWRLHNDIPGRGWVDGGHPIYFNANGYDISLIEESRDQDFMWLSSSAYIAGLNRYAEYSRYITASRLTMHLEFGPVHSLNIDGYDGVLKPVGNTATYPRTVALAVYVESNGVTSWLNKDGSWVPDEAMITYALESGRMSLELPIDAYVDKVLLGVRIYYLTSTWELDIYTPLYSLIFSENRTLLEKASVNTIYNDDNNVIMTRDSEFAPAMDKVALPSVIQNGIFARVGDYVKAARLWYWVDSSRQQMVVWNHLSLLAYYAKPNNLISGTIVNADITRVAAIYTWKGKEHILISGKYNYLTGQIEGATLREFARYEDMWSEVAGAELPASEESSQNNKESGSASSSAPSSTYTTTQTVNIGSGGGGTGASNLADLQDVNVDNVTAQSVLWYNGTSWVGLSKSSLLSGYVTEAKLATSIQDVNTAIGLKADKTYVDTEFAKYLLKEATSQTIKGDIRIEGNFVVTGDTASGGEGSSDVNVGIDEEQLKEYLDANQYVTEAWIAEQHYVTLATYATGIGQLGNRITTIENSYVTGSTLASYALKSEIPTTLPASDVYAWAKKSSLALSDVPDLSSKYLPLSGGTIDGSSSSPLKINTSSTTIGIPLNVSNVNKSWIGWSAGQGIYLWNATANKYLGVKEDGTPYYDSYTLVHSGNIKDYKAGGLQTSGGADAVTVDTSKNVTIGGELRMANQKAICFNDTAGARQAALYMSNGNNLWLGYESAANGYNTYIAGKEVSFRYNGNSSVGMILNSSGNVTVGASDLAGTGTKLYVDGSIRNKGIVINRSSDNAAAYYISEGASAMLEIRTAGGSVPIVFNTNYNGAGERMRVNGNGNVLIGTTTDSGYKLDVNGRMQVQHASNPFLKLTSDTYNAFIQLLSTGDVAIGKSSALGLRIAQSGAISTDYGITAKTLTIGSTAGEAHIMFMRESANYITALASGSINFVMGGKAVSLANSVLRIKDGSVEVNGNLIVTGDTAVA